MNIKSRFTIRDLENFSGIKAHTIRMWEKRYELFSPERTEGNQRTYAHEELVKLLNVKLLYDSGHKISKIAKLTNEEKQSIVLDLVSSDFKESEAIEAMKIAMLTFNQELFDKTYVNLLSDLSFRRVFLDVFIPLLEQIGFLWQVDSISPAHEHFVTSLIQRKIVVNIERMQSFHQVSQERVYVLYLPEDELHDLGIQYLNYELSMRGLKTIFLGQSVPLKNLVGLKQCFEKITFISYFTIAPSSDTLPGYVNNINKSLLDRDNDEFFLVGKKAAEVPKTGNKPNLKLFVGLSEVLEHID